MFTYMAGKRTLIYFTDIEVVSNLILCLLHIFEILSEIHFNEKKDLKNGN